MPQEQFDTRSRGEARGSVLPNPTLPKGGGAIAPIGEKFVSNPQMGTATFSIPVFTSPGRGGFEPKIELAYDAGSGNGSFGVGWSLSVPNISRKTDKGLPRYEDASESDVFVLSGAEDLVPIATSVSKGETVVRYRPRIDQAFARIERHLRSDGTQYWIAWTRDNVRSVFGHSAAAQIADLTNRRRVFRWMLEWTDDDKGNVIAYIYKPENDTNVPLMLPEQNRSHTNLYLKAITYANPQPRASRDVPPVDLSQGRAAALASWPLVVLFDYGDHDASVPTLTEGAWAARLDPFSSYRSGFEIRTHRLCRRVLMLHRFDALGPSHVVVRSTDLGYKQTPAIAYLTSATLVGWNQKNGGDYETKSMPAIAMGYGEVGTLDHTLHVLDDDSARNLPDGIAGAYSLIDYHGEGLPGVFSEEAGGAWLYKRPDGRDEAGGGHFGRVSRLDPRPAVALAEGFQLQDVNSDGLLDLVRLGKKPEGVFERSDDEWEPFRPFPSAPNIDWSDPNLRFVDLDGDGFPDVLIVDRDVFRWHHALGLDGYAEELRTPKPLDHKGPVPLFATEHEAVLLADMTGDGLSDIVHVQNGSVCYWPNLGYGRFGKRVQMANSPRLDSPEEFDPRRVRFADIDGTGTSDLVYLRGDGIHIFLNEAGNSLFAQPVIRSVPSVHDFAAFSITDLWGTGTACLLWSSPLPADRLKPLRWVDMLHGHKPHLLETIDNGLGTKTTIEHAPSTQFYLQDRAARFPWITKIPFPVHVVARVIVDDAVSETRLVTRYRYHHGFYDGFEREFRGFGMVEQLDTETLAEFAGHGTYPRGLDETLHLPPTLTKTWYHTGAFLDADVVSQQLLQEYFSAQNVAVLVDSTIAGNMSPSEQREAYRVLRGHPLRQEVYALDGNEAPYVVTENNYTIRLEHARDVGRHAVFSVHPRETVTHHLERRVDDGRVLHEFVLRVGKYGDIQEKVAIAYPRSAVPARRSEQERLWATHTLATTTPDHDALDDDFRVTVPFETILSELVGLPTDHVLSYGEVVTFAALAEQPWTRPDQRVAPGRWVVHRAQVRYWNDTATTELPAGESGVKALPSKTLTLALTRGYLDDVWKGRAAGTDGLAQQGGYLVEADLFWAYSGTIHYSAKQFFLPISMTDPFNNISQVHYETQSLLIPDWIQDPVGNRTLVTNDYRLLSASAITDPNGTTERVIADALGIVIETGVYGKAGEGGILTTLDYVFYSNPSAPTAIHSIAVQEFGTTKREETWVYSDGLGREVLSKRRVEAGPIDLTDPDSSELDPRFIGTGRTVFNNKGQSVKKYEPYFSPTSTFDTEATIVKQGVTPVLHYDPLGRLIRTDLPNGTYSQVLFDAWVQETWDEIDTLDATSPWYVARSSGAFAREPALEQAAALGALKLSKTPVRSHLDSLGRIVATVKDAGATDPQRYHETSLTLDVQGAVLSVTDPQKLAVARHSFDLAGRQLFADSVDAGHTWTLMDALGQTLYVWRADAGDPNAFRLRNDYDAARRLIGRWELSDGATMERLRERVVYRDGVTAPQNSAGRVLAELDGAGIAQYEYDFRGATVRSSRHLVADPQSLPDWSSHATWDGTTPLPSTVESEELAVTFGYDAIGRETVHQAFVAARPAGTVRRHYDRAGKLFSIDADLPSRSSPTLFVASVNYDAHGRRVDIEWGHGGSTKYTYDPLTFRLNTIITSKGRQLFQSLVYIYDPIGNITAIRDDAQDSIYFRNAVINPERDYTYDALYRLRSAIGREHLGQAAPDQRDVPDPLALPVAHPNDLAKIVRYLEQYAYDPSGNLQSLIHTGAAAWTRSYTLAPNSNRLAKTTVGGFDSRYGYDVRGNMISMPHLDAMAWNHRDLLIAATRTRVGNTIDPAVATPVSNPVFFAYDQRGQRVLKQSRTPTLIRDRIYLSGFELYRERPFPGGAPSLQRDTLHITDGQRRVALIETRTLGADGSPEEQLRYQHDDHLGSAILELDDTASLVSYEEFHPYGTTALFAGLGSKRYRYTAKERDEETGFYYHGIRYYAPWVAVWMSYDPAGRIDGPNLYAYVRNNPIRYSDPTGLTLEVDKKQVSGGSPFYRRFSTDPVKKETLDVMMSSKHLYSYAHDDLEFELRFRSYVVSYSKKLAHSTMQFPKKGEPIASGRGLKYWKQNKAAGGLEMVADVGPSRALRELFRAGIEGRVTTDCGTAVWIIYHRALLSSVRHDSHYDRLIEGWTSSSDAFRFQGDLSTRAAPTFGRYVWDTLPGDWVSFHKPNVTPEQSAYAFENAVYLGQKFFYGHPLGIATQQSMINSIESETREWSSKAILQEGWVEERFFFRNLRALVEGRPSSLSPADKQGPPN